MEIYTGHGIRHLDSKNGEKCNCTNLKQSLTFNANYE
jgi:hypothetical protein